jgi:HEAT repeat protein
VTSTLAEIGGNEVQARLLAVLRDKQDHPDVRRPVARALGQLGERAVVPELLRFMAASSYFNQDSADALKEVARDRTTIRAFARLLRKSTIADGVHRTLWTISQREKVHVSMLDWKVIKLFRVSRW